MNRLWLAVGLLALVGCKSEGRKAANSCLEETDKLERAVKCTFACATYPTDEAAKESCPEAKKAMDKACFENDSNKKRCQDICREAAVSNVPAALRPGCDALLKY